MDLYDQVNSLINEILKIPGTKIVTLVSKREVFKIDIRNNGRFGYEIHHKAMFLAKILTALGMGGGMMIREFSTLKYQRKMPNGKILWLPEKNLYGVCMTKGAWFGLNKEQVQQGCETDCITGEYLPREEGVHYRDFPTNNNAC
jgi:hypothetical protein